MLRFLNQPRADDVLHVILVVSNPCLYKRRYQLARECLARLQGTPYIQVYLVELAYGDQSFALTDPKNPRHLQLRTETPLWHKENMINVGVRRLLPSNWKAFAWVDADLQFANPMWGRHTLERLHAANVVQLFDSITYLDAYNKPERTEPGYIRVLRETGAVGGHCGFAWAIRRDAYEQVGGLFEYSLLGGGDAVMANAFAFRGKRTIFPGNSTEYTTAIQDYGKKCASLRVNFVPGIIYHYFHGTLKNRQYGGREQVLVRHQFDPAFVTKDAAGVLIPAPGCPPKFLEDVMRHFRMRNEDDWETPTNGDPDDLKVPADANTEAGP